MVRIRLLGSLAIEVGGEALDLPASRRAQALLGWLALHPGMHARGQLAGRFWPDVLDASARQSLRSAAWALRRALGPDGDHALRALREEIGLEGVLTDVAEFNRDADEGRLEEAIGLVRGDLLAGLGDDWVHEAREEQRAREADVLERLAEAAEQTGDLRGALEWSRRRVALDPLAEAPARALMRRLAAAGERSAALAVYAKLRERLRIEIGMSPGPETRAVADELRRAEPVHAPAPAASAPRESIPLVGREAELEHLEALRRTGGGVVVLSGESGIGKTRLAGEALRRAAADGARTAVCAALDIGGAAPFSVWAELLRVLVRELPPPPGGAVWPGELARLVPELGTAPGPPAPPELERARLFEATVELFEWASADRPLAVLIDDLHMADPASLELAAYVGRRTPAMRATVIATRCQSPPRPEVDAVLGALARRGALLGDVQVGPLTTSDLATLVRGMAELPDADVDRVAEAAEGNPLLAVESARAAAAGDTGPAAGLRASVRAQLASLDHEARSLAELLAVSVRELDRAECTAAGVCEDLAGAAGAVADCGLLAAAGGRMGYRHRLLREAVYEELPDPRRAWLHERLADGLRTMSEQGSSRREAEVARHLVLAGSGERAVEHLRRAAAHARSVAALPEAADFLNEALVIAPHDPALRLELAEVEAWRGRSAQSEAAFERACALLNPRDAEPIVDAWLRRARWLRGPTCDPLGSLAAYEYVLEVLDAAGLEARAERAEALAGCAWCQAAGGRADVVDGLLARVHELMAGRPPDDRLTHDVGAARQFALMRAGRFKDSYGPGIAAGEAAQRAGRPDMAYGAWGNTASAAAAAGELDRALEFAERSLYAARGTCTPLECAVLSAKSQILARMERLDEALAVAEEERELADRLDRPDLAAGADHDRGVIALAAGRFDDAAALLSSALETGGPFGRPLARLALADAHARVGRPDEAERELRATTLEPVGPGDFPGTLVARLTRVQGLVALARGDRELAERRLAESAEGWRRHASPAEAGAAYLANLIDFGRPAITGLVEPIYELRNVEAELDALKATPA